MTIHSTFLPDALIDDPTDADAVHTQTMALFTSTTLPGEEGARRAGANILWRRERGGILVTSDLPASDVPAGAEVWTQQLPNLQAGQQVQFVATVDAVARVKGHSRRVSDVAGWFGRKVAGVLDDVSITWIGASPSYRRGAPLDQTFIVGSAQVRSAEILTRWAREGFGRSKAFGCGMFEVVPA